MIFSKVLLRAVREPPLRLSRNVSYTSVGAIINCPKKRSWKYTLYLCHSVNEYQFVGEGLRALPKKRLIKCTLYLRYNVKELPIVGVGFPDDPMQSVYKYYTFRFDAQRKWQFLVTFLICSFVGATHGQSLSQLTLTAPFTQRSLFGVHLCLLHR